MRPTPDLCVRKADLFAALGYKPHPGQWEVHRSTARRRVVACGTRWGKSTVGIHETIVELLTPRADGRGWLVAPTYELTTRIFRRVVEIMSERFKHRILEFEPSRHRLVVANLGGERTELRARSADRPAGLLGDSLDFLVVDEAASLRSGTWDTFLSPRLVDRPGSRALVLSTPAGPGEFYRLFRRGQTGRDPDYASWSMPTWTNPHLPADAIESERSRLAPEIFAAQYGAEFVGVGLEVCPTCQGPRRNAASCVLLRGDEEPLLCPDCKGIVGDDGVTRVGIDGNDKPFTLLICLRDPLDFEPHLPGMPDPDPQPELDPISDSMAS